MADAVSTTSLAVSEKTDYKGPKLRLALIGCGGISETHMVSLAAMPEVDVVAAVDSNPARLQIMKEKWKVGKLFQDWKKMLKEVKPDAVSICTPNGLHAPVAIDAAKAGCHVITEKPMAMNPDECHRMIDASAKAGRKLACGFQFRFHPTVQMIKRAREDGQFGNILYVRCLALRRRGIPNWGVFGQKHLQGGGPMIDIGVHVMEMAHYAIGSPQPVAAAGNTWTYLGNKPSAVVSQWPGWDWKTYTVEDLAIGQIRFATGAILHIESSFVAHIEKNAWNFTLMGEKGGANYDPPAIYTDRAGTMLNCTPGFLPEAGWQTLFDLKIRNFVDAVLHNTPLESPGEAGLAVQKMIDGVYRAAEAGHEVPIT